MKYGKSKVCPGNSQYSNITSPGKKVIIFSDSICQRIRLKEFNSFNNYGHADKKCFPGATAKELLHYCLPSLIEHNPDEVIIHVGTNGLGKNNATDISNDLFNIVKLCHNYGVNTVHVSTIAFKPGYLKIVEEITKLICEKQVFYEYRVIKNANITREHIWRDKIHLNESGLSLLANNFIQAINRKHTA